MRTIVIGDIHGSYRSLQEGLRKINFRIGEDRLICLGDYVDGWAEPVEVIQRLIKIQEKSPFENIYILGNHDWWVNDILTRDFSKFRDEAYIKSTYNLWWQHGGEATYRAFQGLKDDDILELKAKFLDVLKLYYVEDNKLFVHAGFDPLRGFKETLRVDPQSIYWDRSLYETALSYSSLKGKGANLQGKDAIDGYSKIYIGHTPTVKYNIMKPSILGNVINVDQGCKINGVLTLWDDNTNTFVQTDEIVRS